MNYDKLLIGEENDPYYNLAWEEALFEQKDDCILLWQNRPSVIVGRHQNTMQETQEVLLKEEDICLVRRMTGGGAVYHDLGNLNFTFLFHYKEGEFDEKTADCISLITEFLTAQGVQAFKSGRNDICIKTGAGQERKISGCAMMQRNGRGIIHGTLLFSTDLERMARALTPPEIKLNSKGITSVRTRVANLQESSTALQKMGIHEFTDRLSGYLREHCNADLQSSRLYHDEAARLMKEKYCTWDWNYGRNPKAVIFNRKKFPIGMVELSLELKRGKIEDCCFSGDYIDRHPLEDVRERLLHIPYTKEAIKEAISGLELCRYWGTEQEAMILEFLKKGE